MPRKLLIGGNHKAAGSLAAVDGVVKALNGMGEIPANAEVVIAPTALHVGRVREALRQDVGVAVQDIHTKKAMGAFTGSMTADLVKDFGGVSWVIIGHSERRTIWNETDAQTAEKIKAAQEAGFQVIFCIGETLPEREAGRTLEILYRQTKAVADSITKEAWKGIVVAYEPVWAIGTGKVATTEQAQEAHAALRKWLAENVSAEVAEETRIIYGGSVTAASAAGLISQPDIDGFLVGGASLKPEFVDIVNSAKHSQ